MLQGLKIGSNAVNAVHGAQLAGALVAQEAPTGPSVAIERTARAQGRISAGSQLRALRSPGIATAIGITVRSDDEADAREQALSKLQGFLFEASAAAAAFTPSTESPDPKRKTTFPVP